MLVKIIFLLFICELAECVVYETYYGVPISSETYKIFKEAKILENCTNDIQLPCDPDEPRRLDGSCNNLLHPATGTFRTRIKRLLPSNYAHGDEPKPSKSGKPLRLPRALRTLILREGKAVDPEFTQLLATSAVALFMDTGSVHDTFKYVIESPHCCTEKAKSDHMCTPIHIPHDDPIHRFSGIRCMNLTRPESFQSHGCVSRTSGLDRVMFSTPTYDLSNIYRSEEPTPEYRLYKNGMIKFDEDDGTTWPPHEGPFNFRCFANQKQNGETKCFGPVIATILPANILMVLYWRLHNRIASELARINPCWSDDRLFYTAREINIAISNQIIWHELLPILMGRKNMEKSDIISPDPGHRDIYDKRILPQVSLEFFYVLRWFHEVQEGVIKMYDENNVYLKQEPIVNLTVRVGYMRKDKNFAKILRGCFLQPGAKNDRTVDPYLAEMALGELQWSADVTTSDLTKGRLFGFLPYIKYRNFCTRRNYKKWEDLSDAIKWNRIELLKEGYDSVEDVDLMTGLWLESPVKGGFIPPTFYCILADQLRRSIKSDRHWYERQDRPYGFTYEQLQEIRKATIAGLLCEVGDIKTVQSQAFRRIDFKNKLVSCEHIKRWNLSAWMDIACEKITDDIPC